MAFRQKVKSALTIGSQATIIHGGHEYSGEVVEFETMTPQDAHAILKSEDGVQYIIPISTSMVICVPAPEEIEEVEDDVVVDKKVQKPKAKAGK